MHSLAVSNAAVIAGTDQGLYRSSDDGASWSLASPAAFQGVALAVADGFAYADVSTGIGTSTGIYRSSDDGASWDLVFTAGTLTLVSLAAEGAFVYTGDLLDGMLRSTDHGDSWSSITPVPGMGVYSIRPLATDLFAGTGPASDHVYQSTDHGTSWTLWGDGLAGDVSVEALASDALFLFGGTDREAVWRRPLPGVTAAPTPLGAPAVSLSLTPNPARDALSLAFTLPRAMPTEVAVIDAEGAVRLTVPRALRPAGPNRVRLALGAIPAGVYFVRLDASGVAVTRKLLVVR